MTVTKKETLGDGRCVCSVSLKADDVATIDAWRARTPGLPPRSAAIRHFMRIGISVVTEEKGDHVDA